VARSRRLYVVNQSTLVTDFEVELMAAACNTQVKEHAAPAWRMQRVVVEFLPGRTLAEVQAAVPKSEWVMVMLDDPDQAGALGWHWRDDADHVYGENFARPCLEHGSTALSGRYAVSSVLSHEVLETFGDPYCNAWADTGRGFLVAQELCDPVEADIYTIEVRGKAVTVSNFLLPEWFDPVTSAGERFDYLGRCAAPFSMTRGGYWVQAPIGAETAKYGELLDWEEQSGFDVHHGRLVFSPEMPQWRRAIKLQRGRNAIKRALSSTS
jgi:hypothetical protein